MIKAEGVPGFLVIGGKWYGNRYGTDGTAAKKEREELVAKADPEHFVVVIDAHS